MTLSFARKGFRFRAALPVPGARLSGAARLAGRAAMAGIKGGRGAAGNGGRAWPARGGAGPGLAGRALGREGPRAAAGARVRPAGAAPSPAFVCGRCSARRGAPFILVQFVLVVALISLSFGGAVGLMFLMLGCALPQYKYRALSFYSSVSLLLLL